MPGPVHSFEEIPYQAIIEQSLVGLYVLQDERFCYVNATFAGMVGYRPEEMIGRHLREVVPADFVDEVLERYHKRLEGNPPSMRFVTRGLHREGRVVLIEVHGTRTIYRGRPAVVGIGIEATERLRNEEELRRSREQLQELTAYTTRKLEEQRLRFARDVHDELGGMLTAIKMDATRVLRRADTDELRELTRGVLALTQKTIDAVKRISEELRPSALDYLDLSVAIARDLEGFTRRSGVPHRLDAGAVSTTRLSPKRANAVYRIFHEALTNVARHAGAACVDVALSLQDDRFVLELRDDGCGFDPSALDRAALGLLSMSERAREIGGELHIDSSPGGGTSLRLKAPLI
jgi:two-component system, NarL family, sensor histidine kinase UhpB